MNNVNRAHSHVISPPMPDNPDRELMQSDLQERTVEAVLDIFARPLPVVDLYEPLINHAPLAGLVAPLILFDKPCDSFTHCLVDTALRVMVFAVSVLAIGYFIQSHIRKKAEERNQTRSRIAIGFAGGNEDQPLSSRACETLMQAAQHPSIKPDTRSELTRVLPLMSLNQVMEGIRRAEPKIGRKFIRSLLPLFNSYVKTIFSDALLFRDSLGAHRITPVEVLLSPRLKGRFETSPGLFEACSLMIDSEVQRQEGRVVKHLSTIDRVRSRVFDDHLITIRLKDGETARFSTHYFEKESSLAGSKGRRSFNLEQFTLADFKTFIKVLERGVGVIDPSDFSKIGAIATKLGFQKVKNLLFFYFLNHYRDIQKNKGFNQTLLNKDFFQGISFSELTLIKPFTTQLHRLNGSEQLNHGLLEVFSEMWKVLNQLGLHRFAKGIALEIQRQVRSENDVYLSFRFYSIVGLPSAESTIAGATSNLKKYACLFHRKIYGPNSTRSLAEPWGEMHLYKWSKFGYLYYCSTPEGYDKLKKDCLGYIPEALEQKLQPIMRGELRQLHQK